MKTNASKIKQNKLFSLLKFIDENELYRLKRYVHSDYFNTNNRLKLLFDTIWDARQEYAAFENIDAELVYKSIFPNKGVSALADDFSSLLKLVKGFLAQENYNEDENAKTRYYVKSLSSKKAHKQLNLEFNRERKKYKQLGKKSQLQSTENYYHNWYMAREKVTYSVIHGSTKINISDFNDVDENLDRLYALVKSTSMASLELSASLRGINFETNHKDLLPKILDKIPIEECPLVFRYFESKQLYLNNSHDQFLRCKTIFDQYVDRFDLGEQVQYCQMMYNAATMNQFNPDEINWEAYQNEFAIYLFKIEIPYFKSLNKTKFIRPSTFLNYINALIKTQKFKEAENKIKSHTKSVMYGDVNLELCYNNYLQVALQLGKYLHAKNEKTKNSEFFLDRAIFLLDKFEKRIALGEISFQAPIQRLLFEVIGMKIAYYKHPTTFNSRKKIFVKFVNNSKKLPASIVELGMNFCQVISKLEKLKKATNASTEKIEEVTKLLNTVRLFDRKWLNNRLNEIKN